MLSNDALTPSGWPRELVMVQMCKKKTATGASQGILLVTGNASSAGPAADWRTAAGCR